MFVIKVLKPGRVLNILATVVENVGLEQLVLESDIVVTMIS